jgi:hypothetical protein
MAEAKEREKTKGRKGKKNSGHGGQTQEPASFISTAPPQGQGLESLSVIALQTLLLLGHVVSLQVKLGSFPEHHHVSDVPVSSRLLNFV